MVIEILSYNTSFLNPLLKIVITAAFVVTAVFFYRCRITLGGILRKISSFLLLVAVTGAVSSMFRFMGDYYTQYKWVESSFDLVLVIITLIIALIVRKKMYEIAGLFELSNEDI